MNEGYDKLEEKVMKTPKWTGERFLPWIPGATIQYEHLHRYYYIRSLVKGKSIVDFACGEGYGSAILSDSAASVVGIDISETCIQHAKAKYKKKGLSYLQGSMLSTPDLLDDHADVLICFEALEHVDDHHGVMTEIKRILKPEGLLILSTPDKRNYTDLGGNDNSYHVHELYRHEFEHLVSSHFSNHVLLGQRLVSGSRISIVEKGKQQDGSLSVQWEESKHSYCLADETQAAAMYLIALASDGELPTPVGNHTLMDTDNALLKELLESVEWLNNQCKALTRQNEDLKSEIRQLKTGDDLQT